MKSFSVFKFSPDHFAYCLQKCLKAKTLRQGKQVHAVLLLTGFDMNLLSMSSKLVGMYASCGDVSSARKVFDEIPNPNVFSLNWMVLASAFNGWFEQAIGYFSLMQEMGMVGNKFSFPVMLKVCVGLMDLNKGKEVHAVVYKMGFEKDVALGNTLVDMYCKCGSLCYGHRVFDRMHERDVASWTSMICGYCNVGRTDQGAMLFERMKLEGLEPNDFTWNAVIAGYARSGDSNRVYVLLSRMTKEGFVPDLVTWNAIISGFTQSQEAGEAFKFFSAMLVSGVKPNLVTITGLLPACGLIGSVERGREIHGLIFRMGFDINVFVASALIDMYSKCGSVKNARSVFDWTPVNNVASWNAMIGCYGKHGLVDSAVELFDRMQEEGVQATVVTLTSVLSACSHSGSVEKGLEIFRSMKESHGIVVCKEHYGCVVDLLCRSGKMVEAYEFVKSIPINVTESMIGAFFNGCKVHERRDLAKLMADDILKMELKRPGGFVTLSNIYAADGEWEEVEYVRKVMKQRKVLKKPGFSWLD
ncbi:PREDICTED: pentatricopeptide repeat-containing protein At5g59600-like [Fragaria vesca subsp. vesca]|uniref:pentatricopeptide repeat-containing protein At5g59600-like n=1 Tax=Fragaria vesca subsp. vesca TaxID=101020 RepID=UPI0002C30BF7|nr:PREDICTED: pentatricopeptide repeat-containing protein At5g59600-like [Fragaria vesca subsp. vesca]XP_011461902.1 PREDICTED: pentatricopeptide repeat-containing protein At5g59600-like [Fragaria vesca subsp. vesca]